MFLYCIPRYVLGFMWLGGGMVMLEIDAHDVEALASHGITSINFGGASGNIIAFPKSSPPATSLRINFAGTDNRVHLTGSYLPRGEIGFMGSGSTISVEGSSNAVTLNAWLYSQASISIGKSTVIFGLNAWAYDKTSIEIGDNCLFSDDIHMMTSDHHSIIDLESLEQINFPASISVADKVWIGKGAYVLKGAEIGTGSIIATRALVTGRVPATELWAGSPAKSMRSGVSWVASHPANPFDVGVMLKSLGRG